MFPETLETERLEFRKLTRETIDPLELYEYRNPDSGFDEVATHLTDEVHHTPEESRQYLLESAEQWDERTRANWAMYPAAEEPNAGEFAGVASLIPLWEKRTARLGVWLRKPFWGRGYSGERAAALIELAFEELDLEMVSAGYLAGNENSKRAIEKYVDRFDGEYDGILRNWVPIGDSVRDLHRYTITREQYRESRRFSDSK
ncbi:GNAT family N-acetyltransferase [Halostagnicola sp. A-GB9-2]|uniref:GNAT family N-acetyltransferase n=1 Tax=Halostagnicola sp. A-GB9-2 TaxID=3048066 RepID=UPI0024C07384|nr:GNAT family N-acetyltransferase [Halostagnicola sp. A-GB9-2]MDJ1431514.1 GNAT family N-acetyltransferase [Halostagnicola sp. A-GB9-2]